MDDLHQQRGNLIDDAHSRLRTSTVQGNRQRTFSFIELPSFTPASRIALYLSRLKDQNVWVEHTVWRSDLDFPKFRNPIELLRHLGHLDPTFEIRFGEITVGEFDEIISSLQKISLSPVVQSEAFGCDGTTYEFEFEFLYCGMKMRWWENHPESWRPFASAIVQICDKLKSRCTIKEPPQP